MQNHLWSQSRLPLPHRARPLQHPPHTHSSLALAEAPSPTPRHRLTLLTPATAMLTPTCLSCAIQPASRHSSANTCPHWATIMTGFQAREGQVDQGLQRAGRPRAKRLTS